MAQIQLDIASGIGGSRMNDSLTRTAGASIGASAVRLTIDDANALSKSEVLRALEIFQDYITTRTWPGIN